MTTPVYIVDVFRDLVQLVSSKLLTKLQETDPLITGVNYDYGHYTDIRERLLAKGKTNKQAKYPLVCLFEDHKISHRKEGLTGITYLKLIILFSSKNDITREQREQNVFRPILYPIYFELLNQITVSGYFNVYDVTKIPHDQVNRPHWGDPGLYKNEGYLFGDVLDGIEIANLQLETFLPNCL